MPVVGLKIGVVAELAVVEEAHVGIEVVGDEEVGRLVVGLKVGALVSSGQSSPNPKIQTASVREVRPKASRSAAALDVGECIAEIGLDTAQRQCIVPLSMLTVEGFVTTRCFATAAIELICFSILSLSFLARFYIEIVFFSCQVG